METEEITFPDAVASTELDYGNMMKEAAFKAATGAIVTVALTVSLNYILTKGLAATQRRRQKKLEETANTETEK